MDGIEDMSGLWRSWERASIALKRSRVRIPPGPSETYVQGPMAQLGARLNGIEKVAGSSPAGSTFRPYSILS